MKKKTKPIVLDQFKHFSELTATLEKKANMPKRAMRGVWQPKWRQIRKIKSGVKAVTSSAKKELKG
ncbi:hypothetical protein [Glaesserella parasuis]|uniref:hypothetical protein n=1 Tax=Glaesserella parasuis TaxID=738 RepID=UPI0004129A61|nr:hypothetical protein [Glaesserella parasuis]MDD2164790.1 hypothetical protein [Glaesserella parasuis]MDE3930521.1 hypothetical protein [Glaesserella parasuis]MDE3932887.1 hypothetical protein [Glaesserella parasuis]MDE3935264.1 hypothetical protein [Glaesserella parasuis]MDE3942669.1 hypothetical protein [Glaesserella parasuis]